MTHDGINKIRIFVDTNKLEVRHDSKYLTLNTIKFSSDFYNLLEFCDEFSNVKVCIPTIVWKEISTHLIKCFNSTYDELNTKMTLYKKTFGDLFELKLQTNGYDKNNYIAYADKISEEFWESVKDKCELVDVDITSEKIQDFIDKAVKSVKPFVQSKGNGKDYSDAGFKDAIIVETIISTCQEDEIAILFTNDTDFNEVFKLYDAEKFIAVRTFNDVETEVNKILKRNDDKIVKSLFETNQYMQETLFSYVGIPFDKSITDFIVESVEKGDELYMLKIKAYANEVEYNMQVKYDIVANEITDVIHEQHND